MTTIPKSNGNFKIGQLVYILSQEETKIIPARIAARNISQTLDGDTVSFVVAVGGGERTRNIPLDSIEGEVHGSIKEVKARLQEELQQIIERYNTNVNNLCLEANNRAKEWFGEDVLNAQQHQDSLSESLTGEHTGQKISASSLLSEIGAGRLTRQGPPPVPKQAFKVPPPPPTPKHMNPQNYLNFDPLNPTTDDGSPIILELEDGREVQLKGSVTGT